MYVELKNINKNFGDYKASDNVNFGVEKGKLIGLLGPSGSGKTTILRMIAGLETPDSGDIIIDGVRVNDLAASKRGIGFVFQNYALFPTMTVTENIGIAMKKSGDEKKKEIDRLLEQFALQNLGGRMPNELSGGQQQRVAIARAIAAKPPLILADEPTGNLDSHSGKDVMKIIHHLHSEGRTIILITHDNGIAAEAQRVIRIQDGKIIDDYFNKNFCEEE